MEVKMKFLVNYLKGIAVGIAVLVPGASGGTMAIILGIYDDLLHSIGSFFENWKKHFLFLLQVGLGGLTGLLVFSGVLSSALEHFPFETQFLFMGVICGGIPVLYKKSTEGKVELKNLIFVIIGLIIVILLGKDPAAAEALANPEGMASLLLLFIAGIVMAVALVLPGISGSLMLLILGLFHITVSAIETRNITFLMPLGLGVLVGTLATTRIIEALFKKYPNKMYMLILGFVTGSLIPVFQVVGLPSGIKILTSLIAFVVGFIVIRFISKKDVLD
jgi:putative membrane protein